MKLKINTLLLVLIVSMLGLAFTTPDSEGHESSSIIWTGKKVTGEHSGTIDFKSIDWKFDETGSLTSADFVVNMMSIKNTDLDAEKGAKLIGHLQSADFFNTAVHPTATFKTTSVSSLGKGQYEVTGDLVIKGITAPLTFNTQIEDDGHIKHATAAVSIDRTTYDIKYGSGSFFDGLGDKAIYDEFALDIDIKKH